MSILYFSSMFDKNTSKIFDDPTKISYAANKYNSLLSEGIALNGIDVSVFAALPVTSDNCKKKYISKLVRKIGNYCIRYLFTLNIPIIKNILRIFQSFFVVLFSKLDSISIMDIYAQSLCIGVCIASIIRRKPYYCVVTDLPEYVGAIGVEIKVSKIMSFIINKSSGYVLLTEQMTERLPAKNKKYVIIEGLVPAVKNSEEQSYNKSLNDKTIVMYAGSLHKEFGIEHLIEAFLSIHKDNEELHLFGNGNYVPFIKQIAELNKSIIYHGVCPNNEILDFERKSTLLVNPRSSKGEYTKYSFPSKVIEYFSSGTPVLMAKLPGIPEDYYQYCLTFDDHHPEGLQKSLRQALNMDNNSLSDLGLNARKFVLENKNNYIQAKKVIESFEIS